MNDQQKLEKISKLIGKVADADRKAEGGMNSMTLCELGIWEILTGLEAKPGN